MTSMHDHTSRPRRRGASVALLAGGAMFLVGCVSLLTGAAMFQLEPAVVGSIDLEQVYNSLDRQAEADAALQREADEMQLEVETKREDIDDLRAELDSFQPDSEGHTRLLGEIELEALRYNAMVEFNRQKLEARRAELIREIYDGIKAGVDTYANENGIDIVFVDDSIPPIDPADAQRTMQQISARRMLFCNEALDITQSVIDYLNAQHGTASGAP